MRLLDPQWIDHPVGGEGIVGVRVPASAFSGASLISLIRSPWILSTRIQGRRFLRGPVLRAGRRMKELHRSPHPPGGYLFFLRSAT